MCRFASCPGAAWVAEVEHVPLAISCSAWRRAQQPASGGPRRVTVRRHSPRRPPSVAPRTGIFFNVSVGIDRLGLHVVKNMELNRDPLRHRTVGDKDLVPSLGNLELVASSPWPAVSCQRGRSGPCDGRCRRRPATASAHLKISRVIYSPSPFRSARVPSHHSTTRAAITMPANKRYPVHPGISSKRASKARRIKIATAVAITPGKNAANILRRSLPGLLPCCTDRRAFANPFLDSIRGKCSTASTGETSTNYRTSQSSRR